MREPIRDRGRLEHILTSIQNLFEFTEGLSFEDYINNKMLKFAIIKNLEIIGEASYMLSLDFKEKHSQINWRDIIDMRPVLVHGYYHISNEMVWEIIQNDLQPLKEEIEKMLREEFD